VSNVKEDELALWDALEAGEWPRTAGARLGIPGNRITYLCLKWAKKGWYNYGTVCDLGWIEGSGHKRGSSRLEEGP